MKTKLQFLSLALFLGIQSYQAQQTELKTTYLERGLYFQSPVSTVSPGGKRVQSGNNSFWLNYGESMHNIKGGAVAYNTYLFPDSTVRAQFGSTWARPYTHCISDVMDVLNPYFAADKYVDWNEGTNFTVDSMEIRYNYQRHTSSAIVDTLLVYLFSTDLPSNVHSGFFKGAWVKATYSLDTLFYVTPNYDPTNNKPIASGMKIIKVPLKASDTTGSIGFGTGAFAVHGGSLVCSAVSFKPGYKYVANDSITKNKNAFAFISLAENGESSPPDYYQDQWNNSGVAFTSNRYNINKYGWDSLFSVSYSFSRPYNFDHHLIYYKVTSTNVGISENETQGMTLLQNFPNPFNETTIISYELGMASNASILIYDLSGRIVMEEHQGVQQAGKHHFTLNSRNLSPGFYLYTLRAGNHSITRRMVLTE